MVSNRRAIVCSVLTTGLIVLVLYLVGWINFGPQQTTVKPAPGPTMTVTGYPDLPKNFVDTHMPAIRYLFLAGFRPVGTDVIYQGDAGQPRTQDVLLPLAVGTAMHNTGKEEPTADDVVAAQQLIGPLLGIDYWPEVELQAWRISGDDSYTVYTDNVGRLYIATLRLGPEFKSDTLYLGITQAQPSDLGKPRLIAAMLADGRAIKRGEGLKLNQPKVMGVVELAGVG